MKSVESSAIGASTESSSDPCECVQSAFKSIIVTNSAKMTFNDYIIIIHVQCHVVTALISLEQHSFTAFPGQPVTNESTTLLCNTTKKGKSLYSIAYVE